MERSTPGGAPLRDRYRFTDSRVPLISLADYVAKLFTDPPLTSRQLVLVVTEEANFGQSDQPVPVFAGGGESLPDGIAHQRLTAKICTCSSSLGSAVSARRAVP